MLFISIVVVLAFVVFKRLGLLLRPLGWRGRPLEIMNPSLQRNGG